VARGILSSLQPRNLRVRGVIRNLEEAAKDPRYPLLFDPQTAGGLLASVPAERVEECVTQLRRSGYEHAARIGVVKAQSEHLEPVVVR
jgi:selenide,water dikinase